MGGGAISQKDAERIKKELFTALSLDLERITDELTLSTHDMVAQAVERRLTGVIGRLERGVAAGLAQIASDMQARVDSQITERFALVAGEVRMKLRKLEGKA
jgi:hypothetical protein